MQQVVCRVCSARVLVRKSSWEQTSVQWDSAALQRCARRRLDGDTAGPGYPTFFAGCGELRRSIDDAVHQGLVAVLDEEAGDVGLS